MATSDPGDPIGTQHLAGERAAVERMTPLHVTPEALDYLAGHSHNPAHVGDQQTWGSPIALANRKLLAVHGIGRAFWRDPAPEHQGPATTGLLAGLASELIPLVFQVEGRPDGTTFSVGTWNSPAFQSGTVDEQAAILRGLLSSVAPRVEVEEISAERGWESGVYAGLVHGIPSWPADGNGTVPWDQLLRSLKGLTYTVLVLADPVEPSDLQLPRAVAFEDIRAALAVEGERRSPLVASFIQHLEALTESLETALSLGGWRTAVYLLGDSTSYFTLAAAWRSVFAGRTRLLDLRTFECAEVDSLASGWQMPWGQAPPGPTGWRYPFNSQTLLDSSQLAALVHLPSQEVPGFTVRPAPRFATTHPTPAASAVDLGPILIQNSLSANHYQIPLRSLTRHAFVTGLTGSGKTNTMFHLLRCAVTRNIPFLVIEPSKTEYRELLNDHSLKASVRVYTVGREAVSPLRLNPFEVPDGIDLATHIDIVKAVFASCFAMWIPLPQVLEQAMVELYVERGWDLATGQNRRATPAPPPPPTLTDLVDTVRRIVPRLGYKGESTQEITASLVTRLESLRRGGRGFMLDIEHSLPMAELLENPTIIELEGLGDDDDKAFLMGLLFTRLYEYRRAEASSAPSGGDLRHLLVIEEAHRLLATAEKISDSYHADPGGAFVELFSHMLSEIRAYGQGVVTADQVPVRLAPDVVKNSLTKICHRLVARDDRELMAGAMSMDEAQSDALTNLLVGHALIFSEGDHTPVNVQIPLVKGQSASPVSDALVRDAMKSIGRVSEAKSALCLQTCADLTTCRAAQLLSTSVEGRLVAARLLAGAAEHADGFDAAWADLAATANTHLPPGLEPADFLRALSAHAIRTAVRHRSNQEGWSTESTTQIEELAQRAIDERLSSPARWLGSTAARNALEDALRQIQRRVHNPYPLCDRICPDGRCAYRRPLEDVLTRLGSGPTPPAPPSKSDDGHVAPDICAKAAEQVITLAPAAPQGAPALAAARWRAYACAVQQRLYDPAVPQISTQWASAALAAAGWQIPEGAADGAQPTEDK